MKKKYIIFSIIIGLYACESYVKDFNIHDNPPKTVVNAVLTEQDSILIYISESMNIDDVNTKNAGIALQSEIVFSKNNTAITNIIDYGKGNYVVPKFTLDAGDKFSIQAKANDSPEVFANLTVPPVPGFSLYKTNLITGISTPGCPDCKEDFIDIAIKIENLPDTNYYSVIINQKQLWFNEGSCIRFSDSAIIDTIQGEIISRYLCEEYDSSFEEGMVYFQSKSTFIEFYYDGYDYWTVYAMDEYDYNFEKIYFSDKSVNTDSLEINLRLPKYYANQGGKVKIILETCDINYYKHLYSYAAYSESQGDFLVEKVRMFSNINNGFGVFGVSITDTMEVDISKYANNRNDEFKP